VTQPGVVKRLVTRCRERHLTVSVAESCTGGLIGGALTAIPGASEIFVGGIIAYSNGIKNRLCAVPLPLLEDHGAVSGPVVEAMARGTRRQCGSDWAIAVSGVAGPTGGTAQKPVGLVWIGVASPEQGRSVSCRFPGNREQVRHATVDAACSFLLESIG